MGRKNIITLLTPLVFVLGLFLTLFIFVRITCAGTDTIFGTSNSAKWVVLHPGEEMRGFRIDANGILSYRGRNFTPNPKETETIDYATGKSHYGLPLLIVSPVDPSGSYVFIKGCERYEGKEREYGICWDLYLADLRNGKIVKTAAGRYGPREWVTWSPDGRYAMLAYSDEGYTWLCRIDLKTGDSKTIDMADLEKSDDNSGLDIDLDSFAWQKENKGFDIKVGIVHYYGAYPLQSTRKDILELKVDIASLAFKARSAGIEIESWYFLQNAKEPTIFQRTTVDAVFSSKEEISQLTANPFPWKGKTLGFVVQFVQMLSEDSGIFGFRASPLAFVVIKKLPSTLFKKPGEEICLAGLVQGITEISLPILGKQPVPELSLVGLKAGVPSEQK